MAVAKGAEIPRERLLDAVEATELARTVFEVWAHVRVSDLDGKAGEVFTIPPVDEMQIRLEAWRHDRFGHLPTSDALKALGVIEELGELFDEDAGPEEAIDALGDVIIFAAALCSVNRLAVRPVIALAELYLKANHCRQQAITYAGMLAHVVLKHSDKIRGLGPDEAYRPRLVDALAMMIAKALEDCILGHELTVDAAGVFLVIGREVLERKQGDAMIPSAPPASMLAGSSTVTVQRIEVGDPDRFAKDLLEYQSPPDDLPSPIAAAIMPPPQPDEREVFKQRALRQLHVAAAVLETPEAQAEGDVQAPTFKRLQSNVQTEECTVYDAVSELWLESDEQLAARIRKQLADLSA